MARILEIKGNSLDDGPGIRSVVFFKGCPLDCSWCHNPEGKRRAAELSFDAALCVGCDSCIPVCPASALERNRPGFVDRGLCQACFTCTQACPSGALSQSGQDFGVEDIMARILRDRPYFKNSGGGVTLSGGEPTVDMTYAGRLLKALKAENIHTLLETCGHFSFDGFAELMLPHLDQIYMDIKFMDPEAHRRHCGRGNRLILDNFRQLLLTGVAVLPRIPLVPGITDTADNLNAIGDFFLEAGVNRCSLMSYNPLWQAKCEQIGVQYPFAGASSHESWTPPEKKRACERIFTGRGIAVV